LKNPKIDNFLKEICAVYLKHNLAISHEDKQGEFQIVKLDQKHTDWLLDAKDKTKPQPKK
jgi:hypothetical protein